MIEREQQEHKANMADVDGSATTIGDGADAGTPETTSNGDGGQGSNTEPADPFSGLEQGTRDWIGNKGYKSVEDIAKAAQNAESLIGQSIRLPGDDATDEDWSKVYSRLGRPESAEGYKFELPENTPEDFPVNPEFQSSLANVAHQLGLTPKQAAGIHDYLIGTTVNEFGELEEAKTAQAAEATEMLEKAFGGDRTSAEFKVAVGRIGHLLKDQGGKVSAALKKHGVESDIMTGLKEAGVISDEGAVLNAPVAIMLHNLSKALYSEDDLESGSGGVSANNPFANGPREGNRTQQMIMIRDDRERALRLMRQAGREPSEWGLTA